MSISTTAKQIAAIALLCILAYFGNLFYSEFSNQKQRERLSSTVNIVKPSDFISGTEHLIQPNRSKLTIASSVPEWEEYRKAVGAPHEVVLTKPFQNPYFLFRLTSPATTFSGLYSERFGPQDSDIYRNEPPNNRLGLENPYLLIVPSFDRSFQILKEQNLWKKSSLELFKQKPELAPLEPQLESIRWNSQQGFVDVTFNATAFVKGLREHTTVKDLYPLPFDLGAYNARAFGMRFMAISFVTPGSILFKPKLNSPLVNKDHFRVISEPCNPRTPCNRATAPRFTMKNLGLASLPATVSVKLWHEHPKRSPEPLLTFHILFK